MSAVPSDIQAHQSTDSPTGGNPLTPSVHRLATQLSEPAGSNATVAAFPRQIGTQPQIPQQTAKPAQPAAKAATKDSLIGAEDGGTLKIDAAAEGVTSKVHDTVSSTNAVMLLKEGIMLSGTHYGLTLISESGIVIIDKNAKILPSSSKPSEIYAKRVAVQGEAVVARLHAEETLLLCASGKVLANEIAYGRTFVAADGSQLHIKERMRRLQSRDPRVENMAKSFEQEMNGGVTSFEQAVQLEDEILAAQG